MKTFKQILSDGAEVYSLRDVIDNLTDEEILNAVNEFATEMCKRQREICAKVYEVECLAGDFDINVVQALEECKLATEEE